MKNEILISIIVPVYNGEKYIDKCLKSLVNQTLKNIEIIVVNDGSKDKTQNIVEKYKKENSNIILINSTNKGVAAARNKGLKIAKGNYIGFVDSDDYVDLNMFKDMYELAQKNNYDSVQCNFYYTDYNKTVIGNKFYMNNFDLKIYMINLFPVIWNKIYKRELLENVLFKEGVFAEDVEFLYRVMPNIKSMGYIKTPLYYYYQRFDSESRTFDKRIFDYIENWNDIIKYYKEFDLYDKYKSELEYCYVRYLYATFISRAATLKDKSDYKKAYNLAKLNVNKQFPHYRKNKYFYKSFKGIYLIFFNRLIAEMMYYRKRK